MPMGKITTENSSFNVGAVYHPPDHNYNADDLIEFLMDSCEQLLSENPNTKIIITGDINRLNIRDLLNQLSFAQLVRVYIYIYRYIDVQQWAYLYSLSELTLRRASCLYIEYPIIAK